MSFEEERLELEASVAYLWLDSKPGGGGGGGGGKHLPQAWQPTRTLPSIVLDPITLVFYLSLSMWGH